MISLMSTSIQTSQHVKKKECVTHSHEKKHQLIEIEPEMTEIMEPAYKDKDSYLYIYTYIHTQIHIYVCVKRKMKKKPHRMGETICK